MADDWFSRLPQSRFSREHREQLPSSALMVDVDSLLWLPSDDEPLLLVERKPEKARETGWRLTRALARLASIPAARVEELANGRYRVHVATAPDYRPSFVGDLTMLDWYQQVELPLREGDIVW